MSWTTSTIGDVLNVIQNGINCKQAKDGVGDKISRIETISDASVNFNKVGYAVLTESEKHKGKLHKNDILFSHINSPIHVGKSALYAEEETLYHGINLLRLRVNDNIDSRFFNYFLNRLFWSGYWKRTAKQSVNQASVNQTDIKVVPFSYPPIPEQQRIVAILDQAFADIEKARANAEKNLKNARELFDSYLNQVFSQRGEGWVEYSLKDIVTLKSGTTVKKELEKTAGDIAYIKVSGMSLEGNEKEITTAKTFLNGTEINSSNVLPVGTTIFPKRGGAIATNKKRITAIPLCVDLNTMGVIPKKAFILPLYLYFFFKTFDLLSISNGTTIPQINNYSLDDLKLSVPDIETQETLIKRLTQIETSTDDLSFKYEQKLGSLDDLKKSLLQQAFSGELTKTEGMVA